MNDDYLCYCDYYTVSQYLDSVLDVDGTVQANVRNDLTYDGEEADHAVDVFNDMRSDPFDVFEQLKDSQEQSAYDALFEHQRQQAAQEQQPDTPPSEEQ